MQRIALLCLPLALVVAAASAAREVPAPVGATAGDLEELVAEYEQAYAAWMVRYNAVQGRERAELKKVRPAHAFWERFDALGRAGEGRAYLWMTQSVKLVRKRDERGPVLQDLYAKLLAGSAKEAWFVDAVRGIARDGRYIGVEAAERWYVAAEAQVPAAMTKALIQIRRAENLSGSEDEKIRAKGAHMLATYDEANAFEGATALDFEAATVEGHGFKLSDYRGKVVLVDFYGFW